MKTYFQAESGGTRSLPQAAKGAVKTSRPVDARIIIGGWRRPRSTRLDFMVLDTRVYTTKWSPPGARGAFRSGIYRAEKKDQG